MKVSTERNVVKCIVKWCRKSFASFNGNKYCDKCLLEQKTITEIALHMRSKLLDILRDEDIQHCRSIYLSNIPKLDDEKENISEQKWQDTIYDGWKQEWNSVIDYINRPDVEYLVIEFIRAILRKKIYFKDPDRVAFDDSEETD
jgi:hypothetical protein